MVWRCHSQLPFGIFNLDVKYSVHTIVTKLEQFWGKYTNTFGPVISTQSFSFTKPGVHNTAW